MPVAVLFCPQIMPIKLPGKVSKKKMPPKNTIVVPVLKKPIDDEVCVTFKITFKKSFIPIEKPGEEEWREEIWPIIKSMQDIDDTIPVHADEESFAKNIKALYEIDNETLKKAILSHVCCEAMMVMSAQKSSEAQGGLSAPGAE
jgi:hypothetical protein